MFSHRLPPRTDINALSVRLDVLRASGARFVDLTESNPTRVGLPYPPDLLAPLSDARALAYEPHPRGLELAREAIAEDCRRRGAQVASDDVVLTASTSEAYSWLFKLLCNAGECVLVPRPSYPLFDHLTRLEGIRAVQYELEYHDRWSIDFESITTAPPDTRALLVVSPNNPTGSYVTERELGRLDEICRERRWALIADEVFADYALDAAAPVTDLSGRTDVLSFTLGGLSK
jgi:aspartate/methionine/tyrosine aminotransferase